MPLFGKKHVTLHKHWHATKSPIKSEPIKRTTVEEKERVNPFFAPYGTPHDTPPFDRIRLSDYKEAFLEGIRREREELIRREREAEELRRQREEEEKDKGGFISRTWNSLRDFGKKLISEETDEDDRR